MNYKLNSTQQLFNSEKITGDAPVWNRVFYIMFEGVNCEKLSTIMNELVEENSMFRTEFFIDESTQIMQRITDYAPRKFDCLSFDNKEELCSYTRRIVDEPTLLCDKPLKIYIFNLGNKSGIIFRIHHILCDGFCMSIIADKLKSKLNLAEPETKIYQYEKILCDDEGYIDSPRYNRSVKYWNKKLSESFINTVYNFGSSIEYSTTERWFDFDKNKIDVAKNICQKANIPFSAFVYLVFSIYANKSIGLTDFSVGMPIFNRMSNEDMHTLGLFMHILPLILHIDENSSLLSSLEDIYDDILDLTKHQKFTEYDIKEKCECGNIQQFFDVVVNYFPEEFLSDCEYDMFNSTFATIPIEICFREKSDGNVKLQVLYRNKLFLDKDIDDIFNQIDAIITAFNENPNALLKDISISQSYEIDSTEKDLILNKFNSTKAENESASIKELFEEKAKENAEKTAVVAEDKELSYSELNESANRIANSIIEKGIENGDIVAFMLPRKSYLVSTILGIIKAGATYLPIDPDYPSERIEYMLKNSGAKMCITENNVFELLDNTNSQNPNVRVNPESVCYCIYTSGSTGMPKGTLVKHSNVVNYISQTIPNQMASVFKANECESIVSTTTVSFDIFVTECLLPLCNDMTMILASEEQAKNQSKLNEITADAIQTTPTKMKMLIANENQLDYLRKLKVIILGGEVSSTELVKELNALTNARIYNFYGPTETTVWSTSTEIVDANDVTIGKPIANTQVYIVDENMQITPVGVAGELCIAGDGVCAGYLNNEELTSKKFVENPYGEGKLYKTGDLAYWREDGNIVYVGRNDFQVKVRGLRIELGEIENAINSVDGVEQSVVVVKNDNENRQLICAYYTGQEKTPSEIKKQISANLPQYMLPHLFKHIEEMPTTSNGKLDRKALPEIDLNNIESEVEFVAAKTEQEKILVNAIEKTLNANGVSLLDNFFDIGGDSLKSISLVAELEQNEYTLNPREIFSALNIKELAEKLETKTANEESVEYGSVLPVTDAQMRVYSAQLIDDGSTLYNTPYVFMVNELDAVKLEKAVNELVKRHESLRTHFENINGEIYQVVDESATVEVEMLKSNSQTEFIKPFDLTKSPLLRIGYYENTVMVDFHHIIADGESLPIFYKELNELYMGRELNNVPKQYGEFSVTAEYTKENEKYWLSEYEGEIPTLNLNTDYPRTAKRSFEGNALYTQIEIELHNRINESCKELGITSFVYYMSAFNVLLSKYTGNDDIVVGTPTSGRTSRFVNSIGMFVNTLALRGKPSSNKTVKEFMLETKEKSINAMDNQSYPFGRLVKELGIASTDRNPMFDVLLAYQSESQTDIYLGDERCELLPTEQRTSKYDLSFHILPRENDVVLMAEYCTKLFKQSTVERLTKSFNYVLEQMLDETKQIKDISANCDYDLILNQFNNTQHSYNFEENQTIYEMFEKTAKENEESVCLTANGKSLTFAELLDISSKLDVEIRKKTNNKKSIVTVIAERSVEMYSAIYGIIRGGNAYLPIAPDYPQDRIDYILENSGAELVVAQGKYVHLAEDKEVVNMTSFLANLPECENVPQPNANENDTAYVIYTSGSTGAPKGAKISHKSAVNRIVWMHDFYPMDKDSVILQKTPYTFDVSVWELFWWGMFGGSLVASKPNEHFIPEKILEEVANNGVTHLHFVPSVFDVFLSYLEKHKEEASKFSSVKHVFLSGEALTAGLVNRFYAMYDYEAVKLHNLYGPTECAVDVTYYDCKENEEEPVPIGNPIYNTQMYVLDNELKLLPVGVIGELHIGGVNVGQGYLNNEELTSKKFIENPYGEGKLYKTGDLAYWREDGNIVYVGRNDFQVKVRGLRIELGEIENAINSVDGVEQSVVVVKNDNENRQLICAFYTGDEYSANEIKKSISKKLPKYMVPNTINHIETMPLNTSGKVDRNELLKIDVSVDVVLDQVSLPKTELEKYICSLFGEILSTYNVTLDSDFFELGGSSLDLVHLLSYEKLEGVKIADFMIEPTPNGLVKLLGSNMPASSSLIDALYLPSNSKKALILFPFAGGNASGFSALINEFKKSKSNISLFFVDWCENDSSYYYVAQEIVELSNKYEVYFYSHCAGSVIALKLLDILPDVCVKRYIAGANIPPNRILLPVNTWNLVPKNAIIKYLAKVGFNSDMIDDFVLDKMINQFRKNTKEYQMYYYNKAEMTKANVISIVSRDDPFTKNVDQADLLWKKYVTNYDKTIEIKTNSHYYQKDNSAKLFRIIEDCIEEN